MTAAIPEAAMEAGIRADIDHTFCPGYELHSPRAQEVLREKVSIILTAAAPILEAHYAAQALRDAANEMPCEHHGSCLVSGNDHCAAPEDGGMLRDAMLRRANRIEADQ